MRESTVARNYAEVLLDLARADGAIEAYAGAIREIADWIESEREFRLLLDTPRVESAQKKDALRAALSEHVPDRLLRFLYVVIDKHRQRLLPVIATEFADLVDEHYGRLQVGITTAVEPDADLREVLRGRLSEVFEKDVIPSFHVDPRILGGLVIRVGDRVMDGSLLRVELRDLETMTG
jgi:F-type H+-transporting ATPase subunit delta